MKKEKYELLVKDINNLYNSLYLLYDLEGMFEDSFRDFKLQYKLLNENKNKKLELKIKDLFFNNYCHCLHLEEVLEREIKRYEKEYNEFKNNKTEIDLLLHNEFDDVKKQVQFIKYNNIHTKPIKRKINEFNIFSSKYVDIEDFNEYCFRNTELL